MSYEGTNFMGQKSKLEDVACCAGNEIALFADEMGIDQAWFRYPDHIAVKCSDTSHYESERAVASEECVELTEIAMQGRRIATVEFRRAIGMKPFGLIRLVELMEPRPEKVGHDAVGIDHVEFSHPQMSAFADVLKSSAVRYEEQSNESHNWVSFELNDGLEVKLNDLSLADTIEAELARGDLEIIKSVRR